MKTKKPIKLESQEPLTCYKCGHFMIDPIEQDFYLNGICLSCDNMHTELVDEYKDVLIACKDYGDFNESEII